MCVRAVQSEDSYSGDGSGLEARSGKPKVKLDYRGAFKKNKAKQKDKKSIFRLDCWSKQGFQKRISQNFIMRMKAHIRME